MVEQAPVVAADIGGTHSRLSLIARADRTARPLTVRKYHKYRNADYPDLDAILDDFLSGMNAKEISGASIASCGYFIGDDLIAANMPWRVSLADVRKKLGLAEVCAINDFVAVAYGTQYLNPADVLVLNRRAVRPERGAVAVIGPGTGLGASVLIQGPASPAALNTEAGQASFAPETDLEIEIYKALRAKLGFVSVEHVLSGPGLLNLYQALATVSGRAAVLTTPEAISEAALGGKDKDAAETLALFCELLGSAAGNFALSYGARGGLYLAGGILPKIREFLIESRFMDRFTAKGDMRPFLEAIPVNLIEHGQLGVIGAAGWYMDSLSCSS
ncbi:glucokinase [Kordiimonas lacus]|uniref:Glucokinase n=1 Tax=Kordiimonas lacus TaxID=637679 RepID=A0A1G6ZIJ4_9PROT|nr:glucokinase [Kordiimonas lacus]SDE02321.1 glucokinase [Kordiimonas lacus]